MGNSNSSGNPAEKELGEARAHLARLESENYDSDTGRLKYLPSYSYEYQALEGARRRVDQAIDEVARYEEERRQEEEERERNKIDMERYCERQRELLEIHYQLQRNDSSLTKLKLGASYSEALDTEKLRLICESLRNNNTVEEVHISGIGITPQGLIYLAEAIKFNKTISSLVLGYNEIEDFSPLIQALRSNPESRLLSGNTDVNIRLWPNPGLTGVSQQIKNIQKANNESKLREKQQDVERKRTAELERKQQEAKPRAKQQQEEQKKKPALKPVERKSVGIIESYGDHTFERIPRYNADSDQESYEERQRQQRQKIREGDRERQRQRKQEEERRRKIEELAKAKIRNALQNPKYLSENAREIFEPASDQDKIFYLSKVIKLLEDDQNKKLFSNRHTKDFLLSLANNSRNNEVKEYSVQAIANISISPEGKVLFSDDQTKRILLNLVNNSRNEEIQRQATRAIESITENQQNFTNPESKQALLNLANNSQNNEVKQLSLYAIANISLLSNDEKLFGDEQTKRILLGLINNSKNKETQIGALMAISSIAGSKENSNFNNSESKQALLNLINNSQNDEVKKCALLAISEIIYSQEGKRLFSDDQTKKTLLRLVNIGVNEEIQKKSVEAIADLSLSPEGKQLFGDDQTKRILLSLIQNSRSEDIKKQTTRAIANIAVNQQNFTNSESKQVLLNFLNNSQNDKVKENSVRAIANISNSPEGKRLFSDDQTKGTLLNLIAKSFNHEVRNHAARAIANISILPEGNNLFGDDQTKGTLLNLVNNSRNEKIQEQAARAIVNITSNQQNFTNPESKQALLNLINNSQNNEVQEYSVGAIANISISMEGEKLFGDEETKRTLLNLIAKSFNYEVRNHAVRAIANISILPEGKQLFSDDQTKRTLLNLIDKGFNSEAHNQAARAIANISILPEGNNLFGDDQTKRILLNLVNNSRNEKIQKQAARAITNITINLNQQNFTNPESKQALLNLINNSQNNEVKEYSAWAIANISNSPEGKRLFSDDQTKGTLLNLISNRGNKDICNQATRAILNITSAEDGKKLFGDDESKKVLFDLLNSGQSDEINERISRIIRLIEEQKSAKLPSATEEKSVKSENNSNNEELQEQPKESIGITEENRGPLIKPSLTEKRQNKGSKILPTNEEEQKITSILTPLEKQNNAKFSTPIILPKIKKTTESNFDNQWLNFVISKSQREIRVLNSKLSELDKRLKDESFIPEEISIGEHKITSQELAERQYIFDDPELSSYFQSVRKSFSRAFTITTVISKKNNQLGKNELAEIVETISHNNSGTSFGSLIFSALVADDEISSGVKKGATYSNFADLASLSDPNEIGLFCNRVAAKMTLANKENIKNRNSNLTKNELDVFFRNKVSQINPKFTDGFPDKLNEHKKLLAYSNFKCALEYIFSGKLDEEMGNKKQISATTENEKRSKEQDLIIKTIVEEVTRANESKFVEPKSNAEPRGETKKASSTDVKDFANDKVPSSSPRKSETNKINHQKLADDNMRNRNDSDCCIIN